MKRVEKTIISSTRSKNLAITKIEENDVKLLGIIMKETNFCIFYFF